MWLHFNQWFLHLKPVRQYQQSGYIWILDRVATLCKTSSSCSTQRAAGEQLHLTPVPYVLVMFKHWWCPIPLYPPTRQLHPLNVCLFRPTCIFSTFLLIFLHLYIFILASVSKNSSILFNQILTSLSNNKVSFDAAHHIDWNIFCMYVCACLFPCCWLPIVYRCLFCLAVVCYPSIVCRFSDCCMSVVRLFSVCCMSVVSLMFAVSVSFSISHYSYCLPISVSRCLSISIYSVLYLSLFAQHSTLLLLLTTHILFSLLLFVQSIIQDTNEIV